MITNVDYGGGGGVSYVVSHVNVIYEQSLSISGFFQRKMY